MKIHIVGSCVHRGYRHRCMRGLPPLPGTTPYRLRLRGGISRQQLRTIGWPQNIEPHWHRRTDPQRILAVIIIGAFGKRVDEIAEGARLYRELFEDRVSQGLSDLSSVGAVIDMGVIAFDFSHWEFSSGSR